jgi:hypothetical protein
VDDRLTAVEYPFEAGAVEEVDALVAHVSSLFAQLARDMAPDEARRA